MGPMHVTCHPSPRCSASQPHGNQKTCLGADKPSGYGPERLPEKLGYQFPDSLQVAMLPPLQNHTKKPGGWLDKAKDTGLRD